MRKYLKIILTSFLVFIFFLLFPTEAFAATLSLSPSGGTYGKGAIINVRVGIDTQGEAINAVQANVSYPSDKLQFLSVSTGGSALTIFAEKTASGGIVRIAGGTPTPGFSGNKHIATINFKVLVESGSGTLSITSDSSAIRNSGNTEALTARGSASFNFSGVVVVATEAASATSDTTSKEEIVSSDVKVENVDSQTVTIIWKTNKEVTSEVEYGTSQDLGVALSSSEYTTNHRLNIDSTYLIPETMYYFKVKSTDKEGNEANDQIRTFTTPSVKQAQLQKTTKIIYVLVLVVAILLLVGILTVAIIKFIKQRKLSSQSRQF